MSGTWSKKGSRAAPDVVPAACHVGHVTQQALWQQRYPWWENTLRGFTLAPVEESQLPEQGHALCSMNAMTRIVAGLVHLGCPGAPSVSVNL